MWSVNFKGRCGLFLDAPCGVTEYFIAQLTSVAVVSAWTVPFQAALAIGVGLLCHKLKRPPWMIDVLQAMVLLLMVAVVLSDPFEWL